MRRAQLTWGFPCAPILGFVSWVAPIPNRILYNCFFCCSAVRLGRGSFFPLRGVAVRRRSARLAGVAVCVRPPCSPTATPKVLIKTTGNAGRFDVCRSSHYSTAEPPRAASGVKGEMNGRAALDMANHAVLVAGARRTSSTPSQRRCRN